MPLTPEDVQKKTFTPVRLREGYDMAEVDQFLDEVEGELRRLHQEVDEVRSSPDDPAAVRAPADSTTAQGEDGSGASVQAPRSVPEASAAAARLLELATNSADQLVGEAKERADKMLREAKENAERLESETRTKAEQQEAAARTRAEALDAETKKRRQEMLTDLESDKDALSHELEDLRAFEREYRARLKAYFDGQLQALDGTADAPAPLTPSTDDEVPRRLRELLGDDA